MSDPTSKMNMNKNIFLGYMALDEKITDFI